MGREEHEIEKLSKSERIVLFIFGPSLLFLGLILMLLHWALTFVVLPLALVDYPWIRVIDRAGLRSIDDMLVSIDASHKPSFKSGRGIALLAVGVAGILFGVIYFASKLVQIPMNEERMLVLAAVTMVLSLVVAPMLTRKRPLLVKFAYAATFAFVFLRSGVFWLVWAIAHTGDSVRKIAARFGVAGSTVQTISRPFDGASAAA
jgi:hypothetical protein